MKWVKKNPHKALDMHCCRCKVFVQTLLETRIVIRLNCYTLNANETFCGFALVRNYLPVQNVKLNRHFGTFEKVGMALRNFSCDKIFFTLKFS